ncbi:hypothetical protein UlMin_033842 [Ulmus minor]
MKMKIEIELWLCLLAIVFSKSEAQQSYVNNRQLDCYNQYNVTDGFNCNGPPSCSSYLTFRSLPPYNSPNSISNLTASDPALIAKANNVSSASHTFPINSLVIVPINCSCSGSGSGSLYYQHNSSYLLKIPSETYFTVANNTYQGLTTCQALISQNPYNDRKLVPGLRLLIPLRCACPTANQTASGVKFLLSYLVTWGNSIPTIADSFGVDPQSLRDANKLSSSDIIFPFTPILVPLLAEPSPIQRTSPPPPPQPSPGLPSPAAQKSKSSKKWVFAGVGIGAALLLGISGFLFCFLRRKAKAPVASPSPTPPKKTSPKNVAESSNDYLAFPESNSWSISSQGIRYAIDSLTAYELEEVQRATDMFSETNKIKGSVYRGFFKGDEAAVKIMKGDVSEEINILKQINHSNIIRLSGFCVHGGNTYLVYEYAHNGSLSDWLQKNKEDDSTLTWKQRVQIAHNVADALNYLHNYTNPPYVHKNLNGSNILLDTNMRAKVSNFGLARTLENQEEGGLRLTRHVVGTRGYMAPEYLENGLVTPKLDVFAFGVVILELLSGREATEEPLWERISGVLEGDNVREKLGSFIDPALKEYPLDLAFSLAQLAKACVARDLNSRPLVAEAFMTLSKILSSTQDWDPSDDLHRSFSLTLTR